MKNSHSMPVFILLAAMTLTCSGCSTLSSAYTSASDTVSGWFQSDSAEKNKAPESSKK